MAKQDDPTEGSTPAAGPDAEGGTGAATKIAPKRKPRSQTKHETKQLPPYNVVLLDDDDHTYEYVIEMLGKVFAHPVERAMQMAKEVDSSGRVIVLTTHKERAEFKRDQVLGFGPDARIAACTQSMKAVIEPAEAGGE
ncbi:MAG: hypothetical protein JWO31_913 [Phycisphaerales bacterium]|nr:hypothetical protein [Phycisphaerales bacterium]